MDSLSGLELVRALMETTYHIKVIGWGYASGPDVIEGNENNWLVKHSIIWSPTIDNAAIFSKLGAINVARDLHKSIIDSGETRNVRVIALCKNGTIEKCVKRFRA